MSAWTFVTNHGSVLACIARCGRITTREIAREVRITERSVLRIIADLEAAGYLERRRDGRVNQYVINLELPLRSPGAEQGLVSNLLSVLLPNQVWTEQVASFSNASQQ